MVENARATLKCRSCGKARYAASVRSVTKALQVAVAGLSNDSKANIVNCGRRNIEGLTVFKT